MNNMEINLINTNKILSPTSITLADYVINPYRGCEFGCDYCYSLNNKNMKKRKDNWGNFVDVKINSPELLKQELDNINEKGKRVLIGSTTEVFQPVEKKYLIGSKILDELKERNIPCVILTKSAIIQDYLDKLTYSDKNEIYLTYNTEKIKQLFENKTPDYKLRISTMNKILSKNIKLSVYISPYFPFLSDYKKTMGDLQSLCNNNFNLYFESYNLKMGNWEIIKNKLDESILNKYLDIFSSIENYNKFWNDLKNEIFEFNKEFHYNIKFFIYPYNDYFRNK